MFENLVQDVSSRTGLGPVPANDLLRAVVARLLHNPQGGFAPLLATVREGGKGDLVAQWLGDDPKAGAIAPEEAEALLGADWVDATSRTLGISRDEIRIGSAVALPSVVHELTPSGMIPAADELERGYAGWAGGRVSVDEAPIGGFPSEPVPVADRSRIEMELALPAPAIKAKAFDGPATLLPWLALFILLPVLSVVTCNIYPAKHVEHSAEAGGHEGAAGTAAGHESGGAHEAGATKHGGHDHTEEAPPAPVEEPVEKAPPGGYAAPSAGAIGG